MAQHIAVLGLETSRGRVVLSGDTRFKPTESIDFSGNSVRFAVLTDSVSSQFSTDRKSRSQSNASTAVMSAYDNAAHDYRAAG